MASKRMAALVVAAALCVPALAGNKEYGKCTEDTQTCLNHMAAKLKGRGWLGIEMDDSKGMDAIKVTRVVPGSPAQAAGFKEGDLLVSVNGVKFASNSEEKCATCDAMKDKWTPGTKVTYVVARDGKDVTLDATLAVLPPDVMAQWIGMHMIEHAQPVEDAVAKN
jgi:C-terminal processing protease CtpA/Prc